MNRQGFVSFIAINIIVFVSIFYMVLVSLILGSHYDLINLKEYRIQRNLNNSARDDLTSRFKIDQSFFVDLN